MKELSDCSILLVDDTETNIDVLVEALQDEYHLWVALDGESALEYVSENEVDLILLDIMMPGMDGYEVCRRLKNAPATSHIPVLFLTAMADVGDKTKGFAAGAVDYITKPFEIAEVKARVRTHLELKITHEELRASEERFRHLAVHDDLTGLFNTRHMYQALDDLIEASGVTRKPISVIFFDLDRFKEVVDAHGHLNGSKAIAEVGETIRQCISGSAFGVAYGGDEFVVVLPGSSKEHAVKKAEEIRRLMSETLYLSDENLAVRLSASFGVASYPEDAEDLSTLLAMADRALFDVKAAGKNAVRAHVPEGKEAVGG